MVTAICKKCGVEKELSSEFWYKAKNVKSGFQGSCKVCTAKDNKKYYRKKNPKIPFVQPKVYICKKCGVEKELSSEYWYKDKRNRSMFRGECKVCTAKDNKKWKENNQEKRIKYMKGYNKKYHEDNRNERKEYNKKWIKNNKEYIKKYNKKCNHSPVKFKRYGYKLFADIVEESSDGLLLVKCKNSDCNKLFFPTKQQIAGRIQAINGKISGENNFYCGDKCKNSCVLYGASAKSLIKQDEINAGIYKDHKHEGFYTQTELNIWATEVKRQYNFICEICGQTNDLTAHHIKPKSEYPEEALDPSNGICLCKNCHYKHGHSQNGCKTGQLNKCDVNKRINK